MDLDELLLDAEDKMEKAVNFFAAELRGVRASRASPGLVENIKVEYYGAMTPIRQLATISTPDPQLIVIKPFDPTSVPAVEKAIQKADIGLNPIADRALIRVPVPPLSEERRKQLAAVVKKLAEEAKVAIRNIRRDANRELDRAVKDSKGPLSEDDAERGKKQVQSLTDAYEGKVEAALEKKSKEILEV